MNELKPKEIATGVYCLGIGTGIKQSNVYFVQSGSSWVLIDAGWQNYSQLIKTTAESLFGMDTRPIAILLTHIHPDHSGSVPELARIWRVPVYVHPDEIPLASGKLIPEYFHPLDRWLIVPLLKLMPRHVLESKLSEASFADAACAIDPSAGVPGLPEWQCIPTPGHTPGHVAFFRNNDGVLIAGDAILTVNVNSLWDLLLKKHRVSGPPYIVTWNWQKAKESVAILAALEPRVLACGHGIAMIGSGTAYELRAFSNRFTVSNRRLRH
ncbi:MAG: MBL fold metallo-hydrolase [ANME-2 cluster archaeon]|nr:MAG: MBL fold metallo-hydrolase [ANME-2 cluster archaeon]